VIYVVERLLNQLCGVSCPLKLQVAVCHCTSFLIQSHIVMDAVIDGSGRCVRLHGVVASGWNFDIQPIGVGTAGAMGALTSAVLKPRGRKYLFAPAVICKDYVLVDSQSSISLCSLKNA